MFRVRVETNKGSLRRRGELGGREQVGDTYTKKKKCIQGVSKVLDGVIFSSFFSETVSYFILRSTPFFVCCVVEGAVVSRGERGVRTHTHTHTHADMCVDRSLLLHTYAKTHL